MKFKSKIFDFLFLYLKTMETNKLWSSLTYFLNIFSIFAYFTQMLSYLFKMNLSYISDDDFKYIENMFFYMNFSNLLIFLDNFYIYLVAYVIALVSIYFLIIYLLIIYVLKRYLQIKNSKIISFCNLLYSNYSELYFWVFMLPTIDILFFPLYCNTQGYSPSVFCGKEMSFLLYLTIPTLVFMFGLGVLYVVMCRSYEFMDLNSFKLNFNANQVICLLLRIILAALYPLMNSGNEYIYHLILHGIGILSIFDYIVCFPIRNHKLNRFYISLLFSFEAILIALTCWKYLNLLMNGSLLFVIAVLVLLCMKKGLSISNARYFSLLMGTYNDKSKMDYNLEELLILFNSHKTSPRSYFLMFGIMKNHAKNCKSKKCKFTMKRISKYETIGVVDQEIQINAFIFQRFVYLIDQ